VWADARRIRLPCHRGSQKLYCYSRENIRDQISLVRCDGTVCDSLRPWQAMFSTPLPNISNFFGRYQLRLGVPAPLDFPDAVNYHVLVTAPKVRRDRSTKRIVLMFPTPRDQSTQNPSIASHIVGQAPPSSIRVTFFSRPRQ